MDLNWDILVKQIVLSSERMDLIIPGAYHSPWLWSIKIWLTQSDMIAGKPKRETGHQLEEGSTGESSPNTREKQLKEGGIYLDLLV